MEKKLFLLFFKILLTIAPNADAVDVAPHPLELAVNVDGKPLQFQVASGDSINDSTELFCKKNGIPDKDGLQQSLAAAVHREMARKLGKSDISSPPTKFNSSRLNEAILHWRRAADLQPTSIADLVELGKLLRKVPSRGVKETLVVYEEALRRNNSDVSLLMNTGSAYHELGRVHRAIVLYRSCLKQLELDGEKKRSFRSSLGDLHHNLGLALLALVEDGPLTDNPNDGNEREKKTLQALERNKKTFDEAMFHFQAAKSAWSEESNVSQYLGANLKNQENELNAFTEKERNAIRRVSSQSYFMSDMLTKQGKYRKAAEMLVNSIQADALANINMSIKNARKQLGIGIKSDEKNQFKQLTIFCPLKGEWNDGLWGPSSIDTTGIGGSEEAVILLSRQLSKFYSVRVYAYLKHSDIGYDKYGVHWIPVQLYDAETDAADIFVSWRSYRSILIPRKESLKFIWLHTAVDVDALQSPDIFSNVDGVFVVSEIEKLRIPFDIRSHLNVIVSPNGLDSTYFVPRPIESLEKRNRRFIYSSQPNYGLEPLLLAWPEIHRRLPNSTLNVYNKFPSSFYAANGSTEDPMKRIRWREKIEKMLETSQGVIYHGMVDQNTLAQAFANSDFWLYPTSTPETSCITAMKAQALGAIPITSRFTNSALPETCGKFDLGPDEPILLDSLELKPKPNPMRNDERRIEEYIEAVIQAVTLSEKELNERREKMMKWAREKFSWKRTAVIWKQTFQRKLSAKGNESQACTTELIEIIKLKKALLKAEQRTNELMERLKVVGLDY
eukprot:g2687.t1